MSDDDKPVGHTLSLLSAIPHDLVSLHDKLGNYKGTRAQFYELVEQWRQEAKGAQIDPDFYAALSKLEPQGLAALGDRLSVAWWYLAPRLRQMLSWLVSSREKLNFTYDLTALNLEQLCWFVAIITNKNVETISDYVCELTSNKRLAEHLFKRAALSPRKHESDLQARYGRRIGWYAFVRATKPAVVIETGVDKGLGTCVLAAALLKNGDEGHNGKLYGFDIVAGAGELLGPPYDSVTTLQYGDSLGLLREFSQPIDLFIHDSDHRAEHERAEFEIVRDKLAPQALLLSDNAHVTSVLSELALKLGRKYLFFQERPDNHFYPGAGIGVAF